MSNQPNEILLNIFTRRKKDGTYRVILNLIKCNRCLSYYHFKNCSVSTIIKLVDKNCFMVSVDLKNASYSIPIREKDRKYLKFYWKDRL